MTSDAIEIGTRIALQRRKKARRGMTLVEIMVVLVILGLIAGAVVVAVVPRMEEAKQDTAKLDMQAIQSALKLYYTKKGNYPDTATGLKVLVEGQYLEKITDPWGNEYIYLNEGGRPVVMSYGSDGQQGGEGPDGYIDTRAAAGGGK